MAYFTYITYHYSQKNKLDKAVAEFIERNNRIIISGLRIEEFKKDIIDGIKRLEQEHPRCRPLHASWYCHSMNNGDCQLHGLSVVNFCIYKSKGEML